MNPNSNTGIGNDDDLEKIKEKLLQDQATSEKHIPQIKDKIVDYSYNNDKLIDGKKLATSIDSHDFIEYVIDRIKKTVKCEDSLIRQILYTALSSYVADDPINLGIIAPTSEGKTYPVEECMKFFPKEDVYKIGSMSTKALVREKGVLVDKQTNQPLGEKLLELVKQKSLSKDQAEKNGITQEIKEIKENTKTVINLQGKILVFFEPPHKELWEILKPLLSHDSIEIEYPVVEKDEKNQLYTRKIVVRGWPACIFCSAKDESAWSMWPEIKSRFLISSPNMTQQKYQESAKLIALKKGLPNLIQQQIILSDLELDLSKECILFIKQEINELKSNNKKGNKISVWIPYYELLQKELPTNKGTDVRYTKRIFSLLNIIPIIQSHQRKLLLMENEISVIAELDDLKQVLTITQNFDGIPRYKLDFFNKVFYPCFKAKTQPDSNQDESKKECILAVTSKQLREYNKEKLGKSITSDTLKKTYLDELINNGIIDYEISKIDSKQYVYYPIWVPSEESNNPQISSVSKSINFDNFSQYTLSIYEKITNDITETWLFYEIVRLICYRIDLTNIRGPLADYLNNLEEVQLLKYSDFDYEKNNEIHDKENFKRLTIREFTRNYVNKKSNHIDIKGSLNPTLFSKMSPNKANCGNFDIKDTTVEGTDTININNNLKCYYCASMFSTNEEYMKHCVNLHKGKIAQPDKSMLLLLGLGPNGNPWET